jgi:hypothetical protein
VTWPVSWGHVVLDGPALIVQAKGRGSGESWPYKWPGYNEATYESIKGQLRRTMERSRSLEIVFKSAMNALCWNGREGEIMNCFREKYGA